MERDREPPHPYQQLRLQGQQAHAPPSSKASPPRHARRAASPTKRRGAAVATAAPPWVWTSHGLELVRTLRQASEAEAISAMVTVMSWCEPCG